MHNAYGARSLLKTYLGLVSERLLKTPEIVWQHGWIPAVWNSDIDRIVGESGDTSYLQENTFLVGRHDQELALRSAGISNAYAIGLPFAYALKMDDKARNATPNSVLVVPALHGGYSPDNPGHIDAEYISALSNELSEMNNHSVLMNCDDIAAGRNKEWEVNGFQVILGGCEPDSDSIPRLVKIFKSFDIFTTNDFGSPIAYAAASGCRVSVWGPQSSVDVVKMFLGGTLYRNRPDLALAGPKWFDIANEMLKQQRLYRRPKEAKEAKEWGEREIGLDETKSPSALKPLIRSEYFRHKSVVDRLGLEPIKSRFAAAKHLTKLSRLRTDSSSPGRPSAFTRNFLTLLNGPKDSTRLQKLAFIDSGDFVRFRASRSDRDSLYKHFVDHELERFDLGQPSHILDIGSYAGYSILFLGRKFPNAKIVGVEADSENFQLCLAQHAANPNVRLINKAVWSENAPVSVLDGPEGKSSNKTIPQISGFPTVEGITVRGILDEMGWDSVDLLKIDIGGSEYDVLKSIAQDISELCSVLLVNFHHKLARKKEMDALVDHIISGTDATVTEIGETTMFDFR